MRDAQRPYIRVVHHQAAVLDDLDAGLGKLPAPASWRMPGLEPHSLGLLGEDVFEVLADVLGPPEDVHEIERAGNPPAAGTRAWPRMCVTSG